MKVGYVLWYIQAPGTNRQQCLCNFSICTFSPSEICKEWDNALISPTFFTFWQVSDHYSYKTFISSLRVLISSSSEQKNPPFPQNIKIGIIQPAFVSSFLYMNEWHAISLPLWDMTVLTTSFLQQRKWITNKWSNWSARNPDIILKFLDSDFHYEWPENWPTPLPKLVTGDQKNKWIFLWKGQPAHCQWRQYSIKLCK